MTILGIPTPTTVKSTWSPSASTVDGIYTTILQNASPAPTIISPTSVSGYNGDTFASDSTFALSSTKQGVTITVDMSTWAFEESALYMIFASADLSAGGGVVITPDVTPGQYTISIGDLFNGSTIDITVALSPSDKISTAVDNTGAAGVTTYFYKNGTLLGSHAHVTPPTATIDTFGVVLSCTSAITVTADLNYSVSGVTNFVISGAGSEVDPASYPVNPKRNAYEVADLEGPMTITGLGTINNTDIVVFGENSLPIQIISVSGAGSVNSVTSSTNAIIVDNTDSANPVLSVKSDGLSTSYLSEAGTYVSIPVQTVTASTGVSVVESPSGTFTVTNTAPNINTVISAGTGISVVESPSNTFTISNTAPSLPTNQPGLLYNDAFNNKYYTTTPQVASLGSSGLISTNNIQVEYNDGAVVPFFVFSTNGVGGSQKGNITVSSPGGNTNSYQNWIFANTNAAAGSGNSWTVKKRDYFSGSNYFCNWVDQIGYNSTNYTSSEVTRSWGFNYLPSSVDDITQGIKLTKAHTTNLVTLSLTATTGVDVSSGYLKLNGADVLTTSATTASISDSTNKRYVTDAQLTVIGNTSGTNTGDQDLTTVLTATITDGDTTHAPNGNAVYDALALKMTGNVAITGDTKTKITYDSKGLVTSGADATTADIADSTDKRYVTDAEKAAIGSLGTSNFQRNFLLMG